MLINFQWLDDGSFLKYVNIPGSLFTRTKNRNFIFIRNCYREIYDELKTAITRKPQYVLAGTAGIGKSTFLLYFLARYFADVGNGDKSFYFQTERDDITFFKDLRENDEFEVISIKSFPKVETAETMFPLFADMSSPIPPSDYIGTTYLFTSFQPNRYKQMTNEGWLFIMPTWSTEEYEFLLNSEYFDKMFCGISKDSFIEGIKIYGGSIRNIVNASQDNTDVHLLMESKISEKGAIISEHFFKYGQGGVESDIGDVLVHRNPATVGKKYKYLCLSGSFVYSFASPYVFQRLSTIINSALLVNAKLKFTTGTFGGSDDGKLFEILCFYSCNFSNIPFVLKPLEDTENLVNINITFPKLQMLPLNWHANDVSIQQNVLYLAPHGSMESVDAFCVLNINNIPTLIALQVTIADKHPVKMKGLTDILQKFPGINNKMLIFITPPQGKLINKQNLLTTNDKVAKQIPQNILQFSENQYKLENNLA